MAQAEDVRGLKERLEGHPGPILSVYLSVNARYEENQGQAYKVRLRDALEEMEVPKDLADRARESVEEAHPGARTLVLFVADDGFFERYNLQVDLPEAFHFGEPYLAPLVLALDEHEPYGVALLDAQEFRFFVSAPMEEPAHASTGASSGFLREVEIESRQPYPKVGGTRDHEPAGATRQAHLHRFFKELAEQTRKLVLRDGIKHLILAGPKERTAAFRETLPQDVQERVVAEEQVEARGPENEAIEEFETIVERAEKERKAGLIYQARESGVHGIKDTIEALQLGQVHHLIALWGLDAELRWCDFDELAMMDISGQECTFCGRETRVRPLIDVLVDLAAIRDARLEFVRAENKVVEHPNEVGREEHNREEPADVLRGEFDGLVGLLRFTLTEQPAEQP
jgi:hypothetical protein